MNNVAKSSGMLSLMRTKSLTLLALFLLSACGSNSIENGSEEMLQKEGMSSSSSSSMSSSTANQEHQDAMSVVDLEYVTKVAPELSLEIEFPGEYSLKGSSEGNKWNRRGSFASYVFTISPKEGAQPYLYEIQFFSEDSIRNFTSDCGEENGDPCFYGDYPTLERYFGQKKALRSGQSYEQFTIQEFNNRNFLTSSFRCEGDICTIEELTTFIGDTKIDIWMIWWPPMEELDWKPSRKLIDEVFSQIKLIEK